MSSQNSADQPPSEEQPLVAHLLELRDRLLKSVYGLVVTTVLLALWPGPQALIDIIAQPILAHLPVGSKLIAVNVFSPFFAPLKVLLIAGVLLTLPWITFQIWCFVAPGLYAHEKRFVLPMIILGSVLAYSGLAFVQFFVLDRVFSFIQQFTPASIAATPDINEYVESILALYLAFAAAFQVPVVVILLVRLGLVRIEQLKAFRGYFIIVAFVIAAVITPPDVVSQLALAIPMCLLYEIGIWLAVLFGTKPKEKSATDADAGADAGASSQQSPSAATAPAQSQPDQP